MLVRVSAAGISPNELSWLGDITKPTIPSHEVSGVVAAIGAEVPGLEVGDEVYGLPAFARDGSAAEYVAVRGTEVARKPNSVNHIHAAAIPLSALTAWQAFRIHAWVSSGQRVLVHGGARASEASLCNSPNTYCCAAGAQRAWPRHEVLTCRTE